MKKIRLLLTVLMLVLTLSSCSKTNEPVRAADVHFFYLELCPGCEDYETAERLSASVIGIGGKALNIIHDEDAQLMKNLLTEKNLVDISHSLPLLVVEDKYYVGYDEISEIVQSLEKDQ